MTLQAAYRILATHLGAYNAMEAEYVQALGEAATYRQLFLLALEDLVREQKRAEALQERLKQLAGIEPWQKEVNGH